MSLDDEQCLRIQFWLLEFVPARGCKIRSEPPERAIPGCSAMVYPLRFGIWLTNADMYLPACFRVCVRPTRPQPSQQFNPCAHRLPGRYRDRRDRRRPTGRLPLA